MTSTNYGRALTLVLASEGGYSNNPKDPGGATYRGITQRTYNAWRRAHGKVTRGVRQISAEEIEAIYRMQYWHTIRGDELPDGVDYALFDYAVNSGASRAVKDLQRCVSAAVDGDLGYNTLSAVLECPDHHGLINRLCDRRLSFMQRLKTWKTFKKGWTARVKAVRAKALVMVVDQQPDDEPAAAPESARADPDDVALSRTPEAVGGGMTGVGGAGTVVTETAQQLAPASEASEILKYIFVALMLVGVGLTVWALIRKRREAAA